MFGYWGWDEKEEGVRTSPDSVIFTELPTRPPYPQLLNSYTWMSVSYPKYNPSKTRLQPKPVPPSVPDTLHYHYLLLQAYLFWPPTFSSKHHVMTFMFAMLSFTFQSLTCSFCLILYFNSSSNFSLLFICKFR